MSEADPAHIRVVVLSRDSGFGDEVTAVIDDASADLHGVGALDDLPDDLECDVVVVGPDVEAPLRMAQEAHRRWPEVATLLVADPDANPDLRSQLLVTPKVGRATHCVVLGDGGLERELTRIVRRVRQRRSYRADVGMATKADMGRTVMPPATGVLLEEILGTLPNAIVVVDGAHRVHVWNRAAEEFFGFGESEAVGRPIDQLVAASAWPTVKELLVECRVARRRQATRRHALASRDGNQSGTFEFTATPFAERDGEPNEFSLLVIRDVTDVKRIEDLQVQIQAAEEAGRAKSAFLANMSHELRTPMTAVIGMAEILSRTSLDPDQQQFLGIVQSNADHLLDLINDVLDFSKIEAGQVMLQFAPLVVRELVEQCFDSVAAGAAERGLELIYDVEASVPPQVVADGGRLRQVLVNLLSNAVKFTHEGEVEVRAVARGLGGGAHELEFTVRDTGVGIPVEEHERLFEAFTQVDSSNTREYEGTGLGLAITKRLVELMGGRLWVESTPGVGSVFHATVLVQESEHPPIALQPDTPVQELARRITLLVDDNATNLQILQKYVRTWEMIDVATQSSLEALEWLQEGRQFDLLIIDQQMPRLSGTDLIRQAREHLGDELPPTLLLTSVSVDPADVPTGTMSVPKPIKPMALRDVILTLLRDREREHERAETPVPLDHPGDGPGEDAVKILIAEDNETNQQVFRAMLGTMGFSPDMVSDGQAAIDAVRQHAYDIVFMDMRMPVLDGLEATRQIREAVAANASPYIVGLTANALAEHKNACLAAGMDDYVAKPLTLEDFEAVLERAQQARSRT